MNGTVGNRYEIYKGKIMVTVVKSEWHQVERRYGLEFDEDLLSEIYPDSSPGELQVFELLEQSRFEQMMLQR